jgi:hypothetical protein
MKFSAAVLLLSAPLALCAVSSPPSKIVVHSEQIVPTHTVATTETVTARVVATPHPTVHSYTLAAGETPTNYTGTGKHLLERHVVDVTYHTSGAATLQAAVAIVGTAFAAALMF